MPKQIRRSTRYKGVYFTEPRSGDRIFYIRYKRDHQSFEERAGSRVQGMTAAKANLLRSERLSGRSPTNRARRELRQKERQRISWTIGKLWDEYVDVRSCDPANPYKSRSRDEDRFNKHVRPALGDKNPEDIDHLVFERWKRKVQEGRSPTTVFHCLELLRRSIRFGTERNLCGPLPFRLKLHKPDNRTTEYLEPEQLVRLLQALDAEPPITGNLFKFVLLSGLRRSEALRLEWMDVDWENAELLLRETKAGTDQRLPISRDAVDLLRSHPQRDNCSLVFPSPQGKRWPLSTLDRVFQRIRKRAELPEGFRLLHGLRHQYGSMLAEAGANLVELRDLLRHSDVRVSERYLHSTNERLRSVANRMGELVRERVNPESSNAVLVDVKQRSS